MDLMPWKWILLFIKDLCFLLQRNAEHATSLTLSILADFFFFFFPKASKRKIFPHFSWPLLDSFKSWNMIETQKLCCEIWHFFTTGKIPQTITSLYINRHFMFLNATGTDFPFEFPLPDPSCAPRENCTTQCNKELYSYQKNVVLLQWISLDAKHRL